MSTATDDVGTNAAPDPDDTLVLPTLFPRRPSLPAKRARQLKEAATPAAREKLRNSWRYSDMARERSLRREKGMAACAPYSSRVTATEARRAALLVSLQGDPAAYKAEQTRQQSIRAAGVRYRRNAADARRLRELEQAPASARSGTGAEGEQ